MKKNIFTKSASIYQLKNIIYVQGYSVATDGPLRLDGPVFTASEDDYHAIGEAVYNAFGQCKTGIYNHLEWRDGPKKHEMLEATKCKTWSALTRTSKSITLDENEDKTITLLPLRARGRKGYEHLVDKSIISSADPQELGRNVIKALELCE